MTLDELKPGQRIRAFHPLRFGVIDYGTVERVGRKYAYINFGPLLGGTYKVLPTYIVEVLS